MKEFDKNIGQYLQRVFSEGCGSHAYIVVGEKQYLPELLKQCALVAMCQKFGCNVCETCNKVSLGVHQDVISLPTDKQKNRLTVKDIAYLVEESYKRPVDNSVSRVFLIDASDSVSGVGAEIWQNKLLKTLEEPLPNVYVFIAVTDSESLLSTVRSRCQILRQSKLAPLQIAENLTKKGFERRFCEMASVLANGSEATAEATIANSSIFDAYQLAIDMAENMSSTKNSLQYAAQLLANKANVVHCLSFFSVLLRESIVKRLNSSLCLMPSLKSTIDKICTNYTLEACEVCIEQINLAKKSLDDGCNASVVVDNLMNCILEVKYRCRQ